LTGIRFQIATYALLNDIIGEIYSATRVDDEDDNLGVYLSGLSARHTGSDVKNRSNLSWKMHANIC
jgi:hypothetical protein